jgi:hypothetical protein
MCCNLATPAGALRADFTEFARAKRPARELDEERPGKASFEKYASAKAATSG